MFILLIVYIIILRCVENYTPKKIIAMKIKELYKIIKLKFKNQKNIFYI